MENFGWFGRDTSFFLCHQGENVKLCKINGSVISIPLSNLSYMDRKWVLDKSVVINELNLPLSFELPKTLCLVFATGLLFAIAVLSIYISGIIFWQRSSVFPLAGAIVLMGSMALLAVDKDDKQSTTLIQKHFEPFSDKVKFRSDNDYFYIESQGMPDHPMMIGIRAWQQQVPIPQYYVGKNAWRIPLKPKLADTPVSAKTNLFRGAIALAVNGVPIFNPIKNDGKTDTLIAGELDEFGGHCGRADDYHYHVAPVHLQRSSVQTIQLVMPWMVFRFMGSLMQMEKNQKTLINSTEEQKKMGIVIIQQKLTLMLTVVYAEKSRFEMAKLIPNPEQILLGLMADR